MAKFKKGDNGVFVHAFSLCFLRQTNYAARRRNPVTRSRSVFAAWLAVWAWLRDAAKQRLAPIHLRLAAAWEWLQGVDTKTMSPREFDMLYNHVGSMWRARMYAQVIWGYILSRDNWP